jgi:hypothetical protein
VKPRCMVFARRIFLACKGCMRGLTLMGMTHDKRQHFVFYEKK